MSVTRASPLTGVTRARLSIFVTRARASTVVTRATAWALEHLLRIRNPRNARARERSDVRARADSSTFAARAGASIFYAHAYLSMIAARAGSLAFTARESIAAGHHSRSIRARSSLHCYARADSS